MKKIIATIAACTVALATLEAQSDLLGINTYGHEISFKFDPLGQKPGGTVNTLTDGYVASYWLKSATMGDFALVGISGFGDCYDASWGGGFDDGLYWESKAIVPRPSGTNTMYYEFELRIFKLDSVPALGGEYDNEVFSALSLSDSSGAYNAAYKLWEDAFNAWDAGGSAEYGVFQGGFTADISGIPGHIGNWFGYGGVAGHTLTLTANPIPEPSTWLLLGAGAAFVVIARRRKKA